MVEQLTTITPDQFKTLADSLAELKGMVDRLGGLVVAVLIFQAVIAISLVLAHARITKNQAITADLLRQGVERIESDLPGIAGIDKK